MKIKAKIVPDMMPNDDGQWVELELPKLKDKDDFSEVAEQARPLLPVNYHIVEYEVAKEGKKVSEDTGRDNGK